MDTSQVEDETARSIPMQDLPGQTIAKLLRMLTPPTRQPLPNESKHIRSGYTKTKMQGESKARRKVAKESRRRNRENGR